MTYFNTRDILAVTMCGAIWTVLNNTLAPVVWQMTHLPFTCDLLGFVSLTLVVWWTRRFGAALATGLLVAALTLIVRPDALHMFGFVIASLVFDIFTRVIGYGNSLDKVVRSIISLISFSTISAGIAGLIIASFFLEFPVALNVFAGLHAIGGFIGGTIGVVLIRALTARGVIPNRL